MNNRHFFDDVGRQPEDPQAPSEADVQAELRKLARDEAIYNYCDQAPGDLTHSSFAELESAALQWAAKLQKIEGDLDRIEERVIDGSVEVTPLAVMLVGMLMAFAFVLGFVIGAA